jgi:hypothetical protein
VVAGTAGFCGANQPLRHWRTCGARTRTMGDFRQLAAGRKRRPKRFVAGVGASCRVRTIAARKASACSAVSKTRTGSASLTGEAPNRRDDRASPAYNRMDEV